MNTQKAKNEIFTIEWKTVMPMYNWTDKVTSWTALNYLIEGTLNCMEDLILGYKIRKEVK